MSEKVTLKEALGAWRRQIALEGAPGGHIPHAELYELLLRPAESGDKDDFLDHLVRCSRCVRELKEMVQDMEEAEAWDLALPKAAASEVQWPKKIPAEGGKYTIVIRRDISDKNRGVITLQVEARHREALEGKSVILKEGRGHTLLRGKIVNGEVSQEVGELDRIVPRFWVEPDKDLSMVLGPWSCANDK